MPERKVYYLGFSFYSVLEGTNPDSGTKTRARNDFSAALSKIGGRIRFRTYLCRGLTHYADLLVWYIAESLEDVQWANVTFEKGEHAKLLSRKFNFLATNGKSPYFERERPQAFQVQTEPAKFIFVYPFVKTHEWFQSSFDERKKLMEEHRDVAVKFDMIYSNTLFAFGLGDYEWILAFECDDPGDFVNLIKDLREVKARAYTKLDTPIIPGRSVTADELLDSIGL